MRLERFAISIGSIALGSLGLAFAAVAMEPTNTSVLKLGFLNCAVGPGAGVIVITQQSLACTFYPSKGSPERYMGHVRKFGLDVGVSAGADITWAVSADQSKYTPTSLAGVYAGPTAAVAAGLGVGVNVLFGGSNQSIILSPISVEGGVGLGVALGITTIELDRL